MIPVCIAFRLGRVWFVGTPASDRAPARIRWGLTFESAARAAGLPC